MAPASRTLENKSPFEAASLPPPHHGQREWRDWGRGVAKAAVPWTCGLEKCPQGLESGLSLAAEAGVLGAVVAWSCETEGLLPGPAGPPVLLGDPDPRTTQTRLPALAELFMAGSPSLCCSPEPQNVPF